MDNLPRNAKIERIIDRTNELSTTPGPGLRMQGRTLYIDPPIGNQWSTGWIHVRNDSGADRDRGHILGIDGPLVTPDEDRFQFEQRPAIKGVVPIDPTHKGHWVALAEPIPAGEIGRAFICHVFVTKVDNADGGDYAEIISGDCTKLKAGNEGVAKIEWRGAGSGVVDAIIRFVGGAAVQLPVPQYQGMVLMAVTQNQLGADFVFGVSILE